MCGTPTVSKREFQPPRLAFFHRFDPNNLPFSHLLLRFHPHPTPAHPPHPPSKTDARRLRQDHRIVGAMLGAVAGFKQQNAASGLPLRLLPEELALALDRGWARGYRLRGEGAGVRGARSATGAADPFLGGGTPRGDGEAEEGETERRRRQAAAAKAENRKKSGTRPAAAPLPPGAGPSPRERTSPSPPRPRSTCESTLTAEAEKMPALSSRGRGPTRAPRRRTRSSATSTAAATA